MRHIILIRDNQKNQAGFFQFLPLIFLAVAASVTFIIVAKIQTDRVGETRQFAVYPGGSCSGNGDCPSGYSCQRVGGPDERECKLNPEPTQPAPLPTKAPTIAPTPTPTIVGATPQPTVKPTAAPTPTIAPSVAPTPTVPSGPSSFLAGTNIWTPNGLIPIETMQTGDAVYSFDPETQKIDIDYVEKVLTRISDHYYTIRLRDGIELFVTEKHPIYRGAGYRSPYWNEDVAVGTPQYEGFEVVKHLRVGNTIYTFKGPTFKGAAIVSIVRFDSLSVPVFNLVVAGARTYFANGVAVHNKVREKEVASAPTPVPTAAVSALDKLIQNDIRECVKSGGGTLQQCLVQAYGKNAPTSAPKPTPVPRKASAVPTSIPTAVPTPNCSGISGFGKVGCPVGGGPIPTPARQVTAGGGCCGAWDCPGGNSYCAGAACSGEEGRGVCIEGANRPRTASDVAGDYCAALGEGQCQQALTDRPLTFFSDAEYKAIAEGVDPKKI
ncbi:MAG: Hint domain-containing protein, partial [Patescibacteria group bacterium]